MVRRKKSCSARVKGRRCKHPPRIRGRCTVHYIKSKHYKGSSKNLRRSKAKRK